MFSRRISIPIGGTRESVGFSSSSLESPGEYVTLGLLMRFPLPRWTPSASDGMLMSDKTSAAASFLLASLYEPIMQKSTFKLL
jgi:hypothetical protein